MTCSGGQTGCPDQSILWIAGVTAAFGVIMIYDASAVSAALRNRFENPAYFFERQLIWFSIGLITMIAASRVSLRRLQHAVLPLTLAMLIVMILVLIPGIGYASGGARRWFRIGIFSIQPGEFLRLVLVLYLSHLFSVKSERLSNYTQKFLPALLVSGAAVVLLAAQPKYGSAVILVLLSGVMFFAAGIPLIQLITAAVFCIPLLTYAVYRVDYVSNRIQAWLHPGDCMQGTGFQTMQSLIAIGSGSFLGVGLGQGRQKMFYLPEAHTDMIFPVLAEELGLAGVLCLIAAFTCLLLRGFHTAKRCRSQFGKLLATGLTASILIPFFLNLMVATGLMPVTGIALPLISYGGTALLTDMTALGLLAAISGWKETGTHGVLHETA